ncbi:MAG: D-tyrosyl-tRNA(Tyr) deacylase [Phycisphaerae bacterium]|nr:D-tyrosyl-tRNA(Tyr) deacylase [Phycisphaerae bacterium]
MRALIQRVDWAEVEAAGRTVGRIEAGLLVYVGVGVSDTPADAEALGKKVAHLRIFEDAEEKLNLSVGDVGGAILVIPNFTLQADARKGRRPAFVNAMGGEEANRLQQAFADALRAEGCRVEQGVFGANMTIRAAAAGPVNLVVDIPPAGAGSA